MCVCVLGERVGVSVHILFVIEIPREHYHDSYTVFLSSL